MSSRKTLQTAFQSLMTFLKEGQPDHVFGISPRDGEVRWVKIKRDNNAVHLAIQMLYLMANRSADKEELLVALLVVGKDCQDEEIRRTISAIFQQFGQVAQLLDFWDGYGEMISQGDNGAIPLATLVQQRNNLAAILKLAGVEIIDHLEFQTSPP